MCLQSNANPALAHRGVARRLAVGERDPALTYRRLNFYVSPDQYLCNMAGSDEYVRAANGFLADRFLYASSYPFIGVKDYAEWFARLPIRPELRERILYRNAAEFLGLGTETAPSRR